MSYSIKVLDHYENPRNVGSFGKEEEGVATGMVGAPACGDVMKLQIKVGKDGIIEDAKFKTYGCGSAIASSSLVTEWVKGKTIDQAQGVQHEFKGQIGAADFAFLRDKLPVFGLRQIFRRGAVAHLAQHAVREAEFAVRARAYAQIVAKLPVVAVVAALLAGRAGKG